MRPPILKTQLSPSNPFPFASYPTLESPHVHFPPTPSLTSTHSADSPNTYDRAPIDVPPNLCELPERGDRVLTSRSRIRATKDYFHPRAFETCERETLTDPLHPPSMVPDLSCSSSESDESDGFATSSEQIHPPSVSIQFNDTPQLPIPRTHSQEELDDALSFLPHPPSPVKDKARRSCSPGRPRAREPGHCRHRTVSAFAAPSLDDGCLGGF